MCGICGKLMFDPSASVPPAVIRSMADTISHRGPDDEGYFISGPVALGFRRLSIIDLSGGHQPLSNEDGTLQIIFNGEIYNYQELREYLLAKGHFFRTRSDTEVIIHLYEELGEACVEKLRGMFAFAIWDERRQSIFLARDRVGIKPLYYRVSRTSLTFASEIKAILADPEVPPEVQPSMIDRFLTFDYLPGEETLFRGISKLPPGHSIMFHAGKSKLRQYWDLDFSPSPLSLRQAQEQLLHLLEESVRLHMISDVPVGFLLSGGVDSTAMLAFAAGKSPHPISSYTVGFSDPHVTDERPYARLAASRYGSEHHEITITAQQFADFMPQYVWHMEEPVCEPPAVALYYVSKLARDFVKVLISGEGGDEAFAGYSNYRSILWLQRIRRFPPPFNRLLSGALSIFGHLTKSDRFAKSLQFAGAPLENSYYSRTSDPTRFFNRRWSEFYSADFARVIDKNLSVYPATRHLRNARGGGSLGKMLSVDTKTWLPDDLLIKADKMTMANSVELRVPLLDHKILEFAASLPANFKVRRFTTKFIARKALAAHVPSEILNRKKAGFPVPYEKWLRQDLHDWVRDILLDGKSLNRGYFRKSAVEAMVSDNSRSGRHSKEIFKLAVLELWHRQFLETARSVPSLDFSPVGPTLQLSA
ncbi:MAG TPA: asparagine synthase (glutamine-hydrolyzing) [Acidobacteriota bacterium]|nr:asparagine synthase (glutamine-hydrolyzing) [Acidobacteriota bacterium]